MSSGTCWHCEGDHDTGACPTRKQWTKGEHQPGSPGVDLDALERRLELDLGSWGNSKKYAAVFAELRTLRARVGELEDKAAGYLHAFKDGCERSTEAVAALEARAESAEARVKELEAEVESEHRLYTGALDYGQDRITDLESQLAAAREEQGLEAKVREALGVRFWSLSIVGGFDNARAGFRAYWPGPGLTPSRAAPPNQIAVVPTIPALLRAILEVEAKGG